MNVNGEFQLRLTSAKGQADLRKIHPDWFKQAPDGWWRPRREARDDVLARVTESDTGVVKNIVTRGLRELIFTNTLDIFILDMFIHEGTPQGNELRSNLQFPYPSQSPSQIRNPDTQSFLTSTQTQTRTVQFPPPAVERDINCVGLCNDATVDPNRLDIQGIAAYQKLSTTQVQTTILAADLLYRLSFSFN